MTPLRPHREYTGPPLLESRAPREPLVLLRRWLALAVRAGGLEPGAMTLATVDARGRPRARMVLLKHVDARGLTFHTNRTSAKGREMAAHAHAALVLWWPQLHRSVRIEGAVRAATSRESDSYFATRPRGAQMAAWTSPQSRVLPSREWLDRAQARTTARFGDG